jgi:hypothetical protein
MANQEAVPLMLMIRDRYLGKSSERSVRVVSNMQAHSDHYIASTKRPSHRFSFAIYVSLFVLPRPRRVDARLAVIISSLFTVVTTSCSLFERYITVQPHTSSTLSKRSEFASRYFPYSRSGGQKGVPTRCSSVQLIRVSKES